MARKRAAPSAETGAKVGTERIFSATHAHVDWQLRLQIVIPELLHISVDLAEFFPFVE
jgi:hypothetical protein